MSMRWIVSLVLLCQMPVAALAFDQEDWPCKQRKVERLSPGQFWTSGDLPEVADWRSDSELSDLVGVLAARRTGLEQASSLLDKLKSDPVRLGQVFAGTFAHVDQERFRLIQGITRFAKKQQGLSTQIDQRRDEIEALKASTADDDFDGLDKIEEMEDALVWDTRIYQDRQQSLTYVCESPVLLERHFFKISRAIQERIAE